MNRSEIIILLIAAIISVVKWVMERGKEEAPPAVDGERRRRLSEMRQEKARQSTGSPSANAEEERLRKFMEALGLPASGPPPVPSRKPATPAQSGETQPPAIPQAPVRPVISREVREPVIIRRAEPSAPVRPAVLPSQPVASPIAPSPEADAAEAAAFAIRTPHLRQPRRSVSIGEEEAEQGRLVNFSSRRALRSAFVMSEILGQPKGLR